jgi:hypothetical protein
VRTRTLLLLSVATGLAILLAGGALLLQLAGQDPASTAIAVGETVRLGDARVTVVGVDAATPDAFSVEMTIGGVADDAWYDDVRLVTGDRRLAPTDASTCPSVTVEPQDCELVFDLRATAAPSRVLVMQRGDDRATWQLAAG